MDEVVLLQHPPATDPRIGTRFYPRILFRYAHWDPDFGTSLHGFPPEPFEQRTYMNPPRLYEVEYEGGPPEPDTF
ncbi:MAG: hypothetical protein R3F59_23540 [Myxococcota bacterium]